jgi:hypothetical protein
MENKSARWLVAAVVVLALAEAATAYYLVSALKTSAGAEADIAALTTRIDEVQSPQFLNRVSNDVIAKLKDQIVQDVASQVARALVDTPEYRTRLTGAKGEAGWAPLLDEIVQAVIKVSPDAIPAKIVDRIWWDHQLEILGNRVLVAEIADVVYKTYGNDLRGTDGANGVSPDPQAIATALSRDLRFADLVAQLMQKQ